MTAVRQIFLTGGTGFFGKSILDMLRRGALPEYRFTILSRDPGAFRAAQPELAGLPQVAFLAGDVRDFAFPAGHFDAVIHAGTPAMQMPPGVERDIILRGTEHVLAFARHCGAEKFLFTSSGAVYGVQPPEVAHIPEDFPCRPVTEYGIAKLEAEEMCRASGIYTVLPRCFAFTGPHLNRNIHFAIGNFIRDALAGTPIVVQGDGTPFRSYLYADDLVTWLFTLLERGENGVPYNVGSDEAVSIADLARTVKDVLHSSSPVEIRGVPAPGRPASRYVPDIRAAQVLGLRVTVGLAEAIRLSAAAGSGSPHCGNSRNAPR